MLINISHYFKSFYIMYKNISKKVLSFGNTEIGKRTIRYHTNLILLEEVDIVNILISSIISSGEKIVITLLV